jgi:hypothetical protein
MYRGLLASLVVISLFAFKSTIVDKHILYPILLFIAFLITYRMHRFAVNYARELFANVAELTRLKKD